MYEVAIFGRLKIMQVKYEIWRLLPVHVMGKNVTVSHNNNVYPII